MKLQKVLPLSAILVGFAALPSLAGSSYVENSYDLKNTFNGRSSTKVRVDETYKGWREAGSDATKTVNATTTTSYNEWGDITADNGDVAWRDTTFNETDTTNITVNSWSKEKGDFTRTTDIDVDESYNFTGFNKTHKVTSGFSF